MSDTAVHRGDDATSTQRPRRHKHKHHHRHHTRTHGDDDTTRDEAVTSSTSPQQQPGDAHERQDTPDNNNEGKKEQEDWEANRLQLEQLSALPENKMCSDCNDSGTRWASVNHGVFVCIRCAGVHRALGTHVSKVKSTTMDKWAACEVRLMAAIGNTRGKAMYEARLSTNDDNNNNKDNNSSSSSNGGAARITSSASDAQLRDFVERKYAHYAFACDDVRRLLRRVHRQVGYHVKAASSASKDAKSTTSAHAAATTVTAAKDDAAAVTDHNSGNDTNATSKATRVSRTAAMKAFYGDDVTAAAKAAAAAAKAAQATSGMTRTKTVHGTFGVVNVPADEYAARLQHLLDAFAAT